MQGLRKIIRWAEKQEKEIGYYDGLVEPAWKEMIAKLKELEKGITDDLNGLEEDRKAGDSRYSCSITIYHLKKILGRRVRDGRTPRNVF